MSRRKHFPTHCNFAPGRKLPLAKDVWFGRTRQTAFETVSREGRAGGEVRRTGIFVEPVTTTNKAPSGAISSGMWTEYAAPTELENLMFPIATNMPRLMALGKARRRKRQPGRARSPAKSQPCGQSQFGFDERGKGRLNVQTA